MWPLILLALVAGCIEQIPAGYMFKKDDAEGNDNLTGITGRRREDTHPGDAYADGVSPDVISGPDSYQSVETTVKTMKGTLQPHCTPADGNLNPVFKSYLPLQMILNALKYYDPNKMDWIKPETVYVSDVPKVKDVNFNSGGYEDMIGVECFPYIEKFHIAIKNKTVISLNPLIINPGFVDGAILYLDGVSFPENFKFLDEAELKQLEARGVIIVKQYEQYLPKGG